MNEYKDKDWLYRKYWKEGLKQGQIARICGVTPECISLWMKRFGISKSDYSKGQKVSIYPRRNIVNNGFKRGNVPWNKKPVGTITAKSTGPKKKKKNWIKIAEPDVWVCHARYVWEKTRGRKIPKGFIVIHDDKNSLNDDPKKLICIPKCLFIKWLRMDKKLDLRRLKKQQEYYQKKKETELRTKGKITPRKIITYVVDFECICGEKTTYYAYEPNKKRLLKNLSAYRNGWQLSPVVRCEECRQKKKERGKKKESFGMAMTTGG